jgi:O-antigen/teichoic acid export membrane protein
MPSAVKKIRNLISGGSQLRQHLIRAAAGSLILSLSSKLLMLLTSVFLARWLGAEGYGYYVSSLAALTILSVVATLGFPTLTVRLLSSYYAHQKWSMMRGLLERSSQVVLASSLVLAVSGAFIIWMLSKNLSESYIHTLWWAMALLPAVALGALRSASLRGLQHVILGQLPENLITPGLFAVFLIAWLGIASSSSLEFTPEIAMASRFLAVAISFVVGAWLLVRKLPAQIRNATPQYHMKEWSRSATPLLFIIGIGIIGPEANMLLLSTLGSVESAGIYQAASRGAELVAFSLVVANMAIQPTISKLHSTGEIEQLQKIIKFAARGTLALALPVALILSAFAKPILTSVFGPEFAAGALSLGILCAAQVIAAASGSVGQILYMTGHEKDAFVGIMAGFLANISFSLILIPIWDIEGAALASALSIITCNLVLALLVYKRTGLNPTAL